MEIALARLIGVGVDGIFTIVYTGLFIWAMFTLWRRKKVNPLLPAILVMMFLLHTTQFILQIIDNYNAFVVYGNDPGPTAYFNDCSNIILPIRDACFWLISVMSDCLIVWRLHSVWSQNRKVVIAPIILLFSALTTGIIMFAYTVRRTVEGTPRLNHTIDKWWMTTLGLMISLNLLAPGLIVYRLWYIARELDSLGTVAERSPYRKLAFSLIESGALYSFALLGWLMIFVSGYLPALYMSACILPSIIAIVPVLIVIRLNAIASNSTQSEFTNTSETRPNLTIMLHQTSHQSPHPLDSFHSTTSDEEDNHMVNKIAHFPPSTTELSVHSHSMESRSYDQKV